MKTTTEKYVPVTGNTYPVKDKIKALGARWNADRKCWMVPADKEAEAKKIVSSQPLLNNPIAVPVDLGPVNIAVECDKYHRQAKGAATVPFRRASSKGEGSVCGETFWGKDRGVRDRYLIVRCSRPYYLSATALEDNDDFRTEPGWYRSADCVAVEPLPAETAADQAKTNAAAAIKDATARRRAIESLVRTCETHQNTAPDMTRMVRCWGEQRMAGSEMMYSDGASRLVYTTSDYDMGPSYWTLANPEIAAEATALTTDAKI